MVKTELTKEGLSESYSIATQRMHRLITEFYEDLHGDAGSPLVNPGIVANMVSAFRMVLNHEFDLIKEASYQYFEANLDDKSKQEELLFGDGQGS